MLARDEASARRASTHDLPSARVEARPPTRLDAVRRYLGEQPDPNESEDEIYDKLDMKRGYTRDFMERRADALDRIAAFEAARAARGSAKTLSAPKHKGTCASVRPEKGARAVVSFVCKPKEGGASEVGGSRVLVEAGRTHEGTYLLPHGVWRFRTQATTPGAARSRAR